MIINSFIDANIFLSFYKLSESDITELSKLLKEVKDKNISLISNDQLASEIDRNRDEVLRKAILDLKSLKFNLNLPSFARKLSEAAELKTQVRMANTAHTKLIQTIEEKIKSKSLDADLIISDLIAEAAPKTVTTSQIQAAHQRFLSGNPPGKKKVTIGDEINWEFLLEIAPDGDLHLVSSDSDYVSPLNPDEANSYLKDEWRRKKKGDLNLYKDLNAFFSACALKIKLSNKAKLDSLISKLAASSNFVSTHAVISQFPDDADFDDAQIIELINIRRNNTQVKWIAEDPDVSAFYAPIIKRRETIENSDEADWPF